MFRYVPRVADGKTRPEEGNCRAGSPDIAYPEPNLTGLGLESHGRLLPFNGMHVPTGTDSIASASLRMLPTTGP